MIVPLTDKVKVIRPLSPPRFPFSNSLYVDDEQKLMIDAGAGVSAYAELGPHTTDNVDKLILTHYHFDHNHGYTLFKNADIWVGQEERWAYEDQNLFQEASGYEYWSAFMGKVPEEHDVLPDHPEVIAARGFKAIPLAETYKDGDVFDTGEVQIQAIHTPGHTPGHYAFYLPRENILFSADLDISPRGPWYGEKYSDFDDLVRSVQRLLSIKPDILVTSHRRVFYDHIEQLLNQFLDMALAKEYRMMEYLKQPMTLDEIFLRESAFCPETLTPNGVFRQKFMLFKHLQSLIKNKRIIKISADKYMRVRESMMG